MRIIHRSDSICLFPWNCTNKSKKITFLLLHLFWMLVSRKMVCVLLCTLRKKSNHKSSNIFWFESYVVNETTGNRSILYCIGFKSVNYLWMYFVAFYLFRALTEHFKLQSLRRMHFIDSNKFEIVSYFVALKFMLRFWAFGLKLIESIQFSSIQATFEPIFYYIEFLFLIFFLHFIQKPKRLKCMLEIMLAKKLRFIPYF